jgi:hypothetical protein
VSWLKLLLPQLRWGAGPKGIPFHTYFLDRVIRVPAVQREREFVTEPWERVGPFFEEGRFPGLPDTYAWSIDIKPKPLAMLEGFTMSEPMQRAVDAAVEEWWRLRGKLIGGQLTLIGTDAVTSTRRELDAAELRGSRLSIDVRSGEILERSGRAGVPDVPRWRGITILVPAVTPPPTPPKKDGSINWPAFRRELIARRERNELPPEDGFVEFAKVLLTELYGATVSEQSESELRRLVRPLYDGGIIDDLKRRRGKSGE